MRYYCINHQGKANAYIQALTDADHREIDDFASPKIMYLLIDIDIKGRRHFIDTSIRRKQKVFIYPHTARPNLLWDGIFDPHPGVTAVFTTGKGGAEIPILYGLKKPVHPVGWTYCEQQDFQPCEPRKVLFAPVHPNGGRGWLAHELRQANSMVYHRLLMLAHADKIELTVRHLHQLDWNGLWPDERVRFVKAQPDQSTHEIDMADVVISRQNMLYLAVARGKPALGYAENITPVAGTGDDDAQRVASWSLYKDLLAFPLDALADTDTFGLLQEAGKENERVNQWRGYFIGKPFDDEKFVKTIESYL